jgi:hypothetical protein
MKKLLFGLSLLYGYATFAQDVYFMRRYPQGLEKINLQTKAHTYVFERNSIYGERENFINIQNGIFHTITYHSSSDDFNFHLWKIDFKTPTEAELVSTTGPQSTYQNGFITKDGHYYYFHGPVSGVNDSNQGKFYRYNTRTNKLEFLIDLNFATGRTYLGNFTLNASETKLVAIRQHFPGSEVNQEDLIVVDLTSFNVETIKRSPNERMDEIASVSNTNQVYFVLARRSESFSYRHEIVLLDLETMNEKVVAYSNTSKLTFAISDKYLAYADGTSFSSNHLVLKNLKTNKVVRVKKVRFNSWVKNFTFTSDNKHLLFSDYGSLAHYDIENDKLETLVHVDETLGGLDRAALLVDAIWAE